MRQSKLPNPFNDRIELIYALMAVVALLIVLYSSGCVSVERGEEPVWRPHVHKYSPSQDGRCKFVDGTGYVIDCDEPILYDYYLAPLEDLVTLKSKLQQCETWR